MPQQFLPNVFQSQESSGIWGFDPILAMVLAFILVPIALAILFLALQACGQLLRGSACGRPAIRQAKDRFEVLPQLRTAAGLVERLRYTARQPNPRAVCQCRRRYRPTFQRARERRLRRLRRYRPRKPTEKVGR